MKTQTMSALLIALTAPAHAQVQRGVAMTRVTARVTTESLLGEMTDMASMTRFPVPAYTTRQFSSYDRASGPPRWDWFANGDHGQFLRTEERSGRQEDVMVDAKGPGAVVRLWSANPAGTLRIYIDGSQTPAIEAKMSELLSGVTPGFPPPLASIQSRGYNLYFPIPFARSCKITGDGGDIYYTAAVRQYAPGTQVESFGPHAAPTLAVRATAVRLATPRFQGTPAQRTRPFQKRLAPGQKVSIAHLSGSQAITSLLVRLPPGLSDASLRGLVLRGRFDGEQTIEVPLGDFFGTAPGPSPFATLPLGITRQREAWSHWVMPWRRSAHLEIENMGRETTQLTGEVGAADYSWGPESMYFHAGYRSRYDMATRPSRDMQVLEAGGQGVFAGLSLAIDNPSKKWWGEGDEKISVDGESFPSWFGTGTEDYFGYAWSDVSTFEHAYHAQPRADGTGDGRPGRGHWGRVSNNRFHIVDRIAFRSSLKFDLEMLHWAEAKVNVATVAYWYARPGGTDTFTKLRPQDLQVRPMPEYLPATVAGGIEGESMRVVSVVAQNGHAETQPWGGLSEEAQMWWHAAPTSSASLQPGDTLTLGFDAPRAGRYRVWGRFLQARDYGIHRLSINGSDAGEPRDFYALQVTPSDEIELGTFEMKATGNTLTVTATGANALADKGLMFGLDYLRLQAAP